jgi:hypothetical protein
MVGLAITTSMLVSVAAAILAVYYVWPERPWRDRVMFVAGLLCGAAPLLVYNQISFGNPFGVGVVVSGHWVYLPPGFDAASVRLVGEYAWLVAGFTPIAAVGWIAACFLPTSRRRERVLLLVLPVAQLAFVAFLHADGACQFGPRMLLPILPFAVLGVAGFAASSRPALAAGAVAVTASVAAAVNLLGALYGTHFCRHDRYAPARYLAALRDGVGVSLPLLGPLGAPNGDAARESGHDRARWLVSEAQVAVARGALESARESLELAAELAPDLGLVHREAAAVAYRQGDLLAAVAALERAAAIDPNDHSLAGNLEAFRRMLASGASIVPSRPNG